MVRVSLLLALISAASAEGAWCALVGLPTISAEAAVEYGLDLQRLAIVPQPGTSWITAVGALLDAVDIVALRPPARPVPGDVRRLAARARNRDAVLMPFQPGTAANGDTWPAADVRAVCPRTGGGRVSARGMGGCGSAGSPSLPKVAGRRLDPGRAHSGCRPPEEGSTRTSQWPLCST